MVYFDSTHNRPEKKSKLNLSNCLHEHLQIQHKLFYLCQYTSLLPLSTLLCTPVSFLSVRDISRTETEGCSPSPHVVSLSFLSSGRGARRERPYRLPTQPYTGTDCGEVCISTNTIDILHNVADRVSQR